MINKKCCKIILQTESSTSSPTTILPETTTQTTSTTTTIPTSRPQRSHLPSILHQTPTNIELQMFPDIQSPNLEKSTTESSIGPNSGSNTSSFSTLLLIVLLPTSLIILVIKIKIIC